MKRIFLHIVPTLFFALYLFGCSSSSEMAEAQTSEMADTVEADADVTVANPVKSQKAYDRGYAEGCRIAAMNPEGRERALIELHAVVSALKRNGFPQSATDFSKGVSAALMTVTNN